MLTTVCYEDVATVNFLADVLRSGSDYPCVKGGFVQLIVLRFWKGEHVPLAGRAMNTPIYEACVMDGSRGVFRIRFAVAMQEHMEKVKSLLSPGCVIKISDYNMVWFHGTGRHQWRMVMLVHSMFPLCKICDSLGDLLPPSIVKEDIETRVIQHVASASGMVFLSKANRAGGGDYWTFMSLPQIKCGVFISDRLKRSQFLCRARREGGTPILKKSNNCDCGHALGFNTCVLLLFPLEDQDGELIVKQNKMLLRGLGQRSFGDLQPCMKRKCVTIFYCQNYFCLQVGKYTIPKCFMHSLRCRYPNPKSDFFAKHYE